MYILDVVPISKGFPKENLSYFSAKFTEVGALVTVPMRKKEILSVVVARHRLADLKADIKNADFKLRNVLHVHKKTLFTPAFIETCGLLKNYYATTTGTVLSSLVPNLFLEEFAESVPIEKSSDGASSFLPEVWALQTNNHERLSYYKTYIREVFARKKSVYIMCPTQASVEHVAKELSKGIEDRVFAFHGNLTKKKLRAYYQAVIDSERPVALVGTVAFTSIPRKDIDAYIIEEEGSSYYYQQAQPFLDERDVVKVLARTVGATLVVADHLLRFETIKAVQEGAIQAVRPLSFHIPKHISPEMISFVSTSTESENHQKQKPKKPFEIFSQQAYERIHEALVKNESIFLYTSRKGLAPLTVCEDCGEVLRSPDSDAPLVLYEKKKGEEITSYYFDPRSRKKYETIDRCQNCGSWRLKMLGIGTDTVAKNIEQKFPEASLFVIDNNEASTHRKVVKTLESWRTASQGILLGTDKALPYLTEAVDHVIAVSLDSLFSIPGYAMHEIIMRRILRSMFIAEKTWMIQTRCVDVSLFQNIHQKTLLPLFDSAMEERALLLYPPFGVLITIEHTCAFLKIASSRGYLQELFADYTPLVQVRRGIKTDQYIVQIVIKTKVQNWISKYSSQKAPRVFQDIMMRLETLPSEYRIHINPQSL
jgi:primosomal protein N'